MCQTPRARGSTLGPPGFLSQLPGSLWPVTDHPNAEAGDLQPLEVLCHGLLSPKHRGERDGGIGGVFWASACGQSHRAAAVCAHGRRGRDAGRRGPIWRCRGAGIENREVGKTTDSGQAPEDRKLAFLRSASLCPLLLGSWPHPRNGRSLAAFLVGPSPSEIRSMWTGGIGPTPVLLPATRDPVVLPRWMGQCSLLPRRAGLNKGSEASGSVRRWALWAPGDCPTSAPCCGLCSSVSCAA